MTKDEAMHLLSTGRVHDWNNYRMNNPDWKPDLSGMDLSNIKLIFSRESFFNLQDANLCGADLSNIETITGGGYVIPLKGARYNIFTKLPDKYQLSKYGAVLVTVAPRQSEEAEVEPNVFISYAWTNEDLVLAIDQWLRLKGIKTKIDKRDFFAGSRIRDEVLRVMQQCNAVVIFYSDESKDKPWTQFERELASDLEMEAKKEGKQPPKIIYFVIDETPLPNVVEKNRIAIMAKGKKFEVACEELYYGILQIARSGKYIDLKKWSDFTF